MEPLVAVSASTSIPDFARGDSLLAGAFELALDAHHGPRRRGETDVGHPVAVAELLHSAGFDRDVVAAALLHDVVEDTDTDLDEVANRFGKDVGELVREMTEDATIGAYELRKAEHRGRVAERPSVAAIYCADKLANARDIDDPAEVPAEKLHHYEATLEILSDHHPGLPFLEDLRGELERIRAVKVSESANPGRSARGAG